MSNYTLEFGKKGYRTLKYKNKYLHSKYDPRKEAEVFIESKSDLLNNKVVIVIGMGLSYHIAEILKSKNDLNIIIFEYDEEIIKINNSEKIVDFNDSRIEVISSQKREFFKRLSLELEKVSDIIIYKPSLDILKDENEKLYELLKDYELERESIKKQKVFLQENYEANGSMGYNMINKFFNRFDGSKPYIIVAAGPSLDYDLDFISKNRERYTIISVSTALRSLGENNIIPDAIVIIDRSELVKKHFIGFDWSNVPLCFLSTASKWAVEGHMGEKFIFYNDSESDVFIRTGKTVAVAATDIAIKCGATMIIFVGQDLAHINGKTHTNTFEKIYGYKDVAYKLKDYREVEGVDGNILETREGFLYFKRQLEIIIESNPSIEFYNSSKGAKIIGTKSMNIREVRF